MHPQDKYFSLQHTPLSIDRRNLRKARWKMIMRGRILRIISLINMLYNSFRSSRVLLSPRVSEKRRVRFSRDIFYYSTPYGVPYLSMNDPQINISFRPQTPQKPAKKMCAIDVYTVSPFLHIFMRHSSKPGFRAKCVPKRCTICHTFFSPWMQGWTGIFRRADSGQRSKRDTDLAAPGGKSRTNLAAEQK